MNMTTYTITTFGFGNSDVVDATSINASGQVTGQYRNSSNGWSSFLYANGTITNIDPPGSVYSYPAAINASGQVAGYFQDSNGLQSFIYNGGSYTTISYLNIPQLISINDSGQAVGYALYGNQWHGFLYNNGTTTTFDPPGSYSTFVESINASGQIVG